ncbi:uncharacterized protein LOC126904175 [Daktulosphaira vitifoliae]|uniref:uncharacterized protein LOC126904175 n=1 Tax=Daktulosphaira vitifoliae TaxID=58002 RepID=UPI0021AAA9BA|nr:uncharacterized protein LOC126904175 [Daktulosphaira vitifoliae]
MACLMIVVAFVAVQLASAFVLPEGQVMVVRMKRNPSPMRTFSFSGFNPNGEMAAFTGAAEYPMFSNYGPPSPYYPPKEYGSPTAQDSYGPPPSGVGNEHKNNPQIPEYDLKPSSTDTKGSNNDEHEDQKQPKVRGEGSSSNAEASFNAWFPIMFGVFPNGNGQSTNSRDSHEQSNGGFERLGGTTVIANSVSNGRNGVATSHAISYGNPRSHKK